MGTGHLPNQTDDRVWLDGIVQRQSGIEASPALEARILASFDAVQAQRNAGVAGAMRQFSALFRDAVWPGVPLWKPATVLGLSLALGLIAGTYLPLEELIAGNGEQTASVSLDAPPAFELGEGAS